MGHWESCDTGCCSLLSGGAGDRDVLVVRGMDGYRWWYRDEEGDLSVGDGGMGFLARSGAERAAERFLGVE